MLPCLLLLLTAAGHADAKPTAPIRLTARVVRTDAVAGTARMEVRMRPLLPAATVHLQCDLPNGAAVVPGSSEWTTTKEGDSVLTMRVTLPPGAAKAVIRVNLSGKGIKTGRVIGLQLPGARHDATPARPKPVILKTNKGEQLRLHR